MPFIGQQPKIGAYKLLDSITTSATATYALTASSTAYFPELAQNLIVSLNGVTQAPISAYTVSGSNIVFASSLTSSDVIDYILALGDVLSVGSSTNPALSDLTDTNINTGTLAGTHILGYSTVSSAWVNALPSVWSIPNTSQTVSNITWASGTKALTITKADATFGALTLTDVAIEETDVTFDDITCEGSFSVSNSVYTHMTVGSGKTLIHNNLQVDGIVTATTFRQTDTGTNAFSLASNGRITTGEDLIVTGNLTAAHLELEGTDDSILTLRSTDDGPLYVEFERGTDRHSYMGVSSSGDDFYIKNEETNGDIRLQTSDGSELRINAGGNVGIGESSPQRKLYVKSDQQIVQTIESTSANAYFSFVNATTAENRTRIGLQGTDTLVFRNGASDRMQINSTGDVLVGTTVISPGYGNATAGCALRASGMVHGSAAAGPGGTFNRNGNGTVVGLYNSGTQAGRINITGSTTVQYITSSDARLKENIVDAPAGNIDAIRVRSFDWSTDGTHQTYGMIAQELAEVAPEAVSPGETEEETWGIDCSKLVPMMIKEIQDLKAEVAALKGV